MPKRIAPDRFSAKRLKIVSETLTEVRSEKRLALLPRVLREWNHTDLQQHLLVKSRTSSAADIKKLELVAKRARELLRALDDMGTLGQSAIKRHVIRLCGRHPEDLSRDEFKSLVERLKETQEFLTILATIKPHEIWKPRRGRPLNLAAYLILQDAAAIFEWITNKKATRQTNRDTGILEGPFVNFASKIWLLVFANSNGFSAAMKNWAKWRKKYDEQSALMANMALRHPSWRIYRE